MDCSHEVYLWIIVMFLSAVWSLILMAPIYCRGSIVEQMIKLIFFIFKYYLSTCSTYAIFKVLNFRSNYLKFSLLLIALDDLMNLDRFAVHSDRRALLPQELWPRCTLVLSHSSGLPVYVLMLRRFLITSTLSHKPASCFGGSLAPLSCHFHSGIMAIVAQLARRKSETYELGGWGRSSPGWL